MYKNKRLGKMLESNRTEQSDSVLFSYYINLFEFNFKIIRFSKASIKI